MILTLTGCGSSQSDSPESSGKASDTTSKTTTQKDNDKDSESESLSEYDTMELFDHSRKLSAVVYFSATGNTQKIAVDIADITDSDIFEIVPKEAYTDDDLDYNNDDCRANKEMNDDSARPEIKDDIDSVLCYDTIYLGYPIWWSTAPRIIQTFLDTYDLSGKKIYTFCTSGGSDIDQSISDLKADYPSINFVSGKRFSSDDTKDTVKEWLDGLN